MGSEEVRGTKYSLGVQETKMTKTAKKEFESNPKRQLRAADKDWEEFQQHKNESGKTWGKFLKQVNKLLNKNK